MIIPGGHMTAQVEEKLLGAEYRAEITGQWDALVQEGLAEWVEKDARDLPGISAELNPFMIWTIRAK